MDAEIPLINLFLAQNGRFCPLDNVHKNDTKLSANETVIGIPFDADGHGRRQNASIHVVTCQSRVHIIIDIDI